MLLVGPDANVSTGCCIASSRLSSVPSFWVRYRRVSASKLASVRAAAKAAIVSRARWTRQAFSPAAFSRSSSPSRPRRCEQVTCALGSSSVRIAAARVSCDGSTGENEPVTTSASSPSARNRSAALTMASSSSGSKGRPSYSMPPFTRIDTPSTAAAKSWGQSTSGGRPRPAGKPTRKKPTRLRSRRCTTALVKWVVPTTTASTRSCGSACRAFRMPVSTSDVVGVLIDATIWVPSSSAASVFVPPTSIPIRLMPWDPPGRCRSQTPGVRHSPVRRGW